MRWAVPPVPPDPKHGDIRYKTRFAIWPTRLEGDVVVWCERYSVMEEYYIHHSFSGWVYRKTFPLIAVPEARLLENK